MEDAVIDDLLQKADGLSAKIHRSRNIFADEEAQRCEEELREIYKSILLRDLDFALKNKVEQHLWTSGFKVSIDLGRENNTEGFLVWSSYGRQQPISQTILVKCLRTSAEFYRKLLVEICSTYNFALPFVSKPKASKNRQEKYKKAEQRSCILMCQNCLTHIGDCVRYEMEYKDAYIYFERALKLNMSNGHTHNQLGLVHSYEGNLLPTLYHYARAIATSEPYLKARGNMSVNLSEKAEGNMGKHGDIRISKRNIRNFSEFVWVFLMLMGNLRMGSTPFKVLRRLVTLLIDSLREFAADAVEEIPPISLFSSLNQMLAISVFAVQDAGQGFPPLEKERIFKFEPRLSRVLVLDLIAGSLDSLLQPLLKAKTENVLSYGGLPTIKLTLDWIRCDPSVLEEHAFHSRPEIWSALSTILNKFDAVQTFFSDKEEQFVSVPLPEDRELEGFTVLQPVLSELRFINTLFEKEPAVYKDPVIESGYLRAHRLLNFGKWLAQMKHLNLMKMNCTCMEDLKDSRVTDPMTAVPESNSSPTTGTSYDSDSDCSLDNLSAFFKNKTFIYNFF